MGQAILTLLGVILGAAVAGGISLWQVQLVTKREREVRRLLREQERKDRRDTFQRETILGLQDALGELWALRTVNVDETGIPIKADPTQVATVLYRVDMLRARVFDDELRGLVRAVRDQLGRDSSRMEDRMNALLKELF
jgi:hypothetical protein